MKKTLRTAILPSLWLIAAILLIAGCSKKIDKDEKINEKINEEPKITYIKAELGGCNVNMGYQNDERDTVIITISENTFNVFVGLIFTCKWEPFNTQAEIIDDVLCITLLDKCYDLDGNQIDCGYERCKCYYTFDFIFKYEGELRQKYKILLYDSFLLGDDKIRTIAEGIIKT